MSSYSYSACTRTYEPLWQQGLSQCVRLYLALDEPGSEALPLELALRLLEHSLRAYLQAGRPVTSDTMAEAWGLLEAAQVEWLGDATRCAQLRRELSLSQALRPLPSPALLQLTGRWPGTGASQVSAGRSSRAGGSGSGTWLAKRPIGGEAQSEGRIG